MASTRMDDRLGTPCVVDISCCVFDFLFPIIHRLKMCIGIEKQQHPNQKFHLNISPPIWRNSPVVSHQPDSRHVSDIRYHGTLLMSAGHRTSVSDRRWPLHDVGLWRWMTRQDQSASQLVMSYTQLFEQWTVLDYFCSDNFPFNIEDIKTEVYLVLWTMVLVSLVCAHMTGDRNPSTEYAVAVSSFAFLFAFYDN